jgi:hypothetical protein
LPNQPPISSPGPTSPNPSPKPPPISPPGPTSPNPQPGGSFRATIGGLGLTVPDKDVPTKPAGLQSGNTTQFPTDYLTVLGINTNQSLVLKAKVLIDSTGKPTVLPNTAELSPGNISKGKAEQLAKEIIEKWTFSPTYMGSEPVDQAYNIELNLNQL